MANFNIDTLIADGALTGELKKITVDTLRSDDKNEKQWVKFSDVYHARGITAAMLATKKKGGIEKLREAVRTTCSLALPDADLALYNKESKAIETGSAEAINRTKLINKVSAWLSKIESHLNKLEKLAEGKTPNPPRPALTRALAFIDKALDILAGDDDGSLKGDLPTAMKNLRAAKTNLG